MYRAIRRNKNPGPGHYEHHTVVTSKQKSVGAAIFAPPTVTRFPAFKPATNLGPGEYENVHRGKEQMEHKPVEVIITGPPPTPKDVKSYREKVEVNSRRGPGMYDPRGSTPRTRCSLNIEKQAERQVAGPIKAHVSQPAPNQYSINPRVSTRGVERSRNGRLSTSDTSRLSFQANADGLPGVGTYNSVRHEVTRPRLDVGHHFSGATEDRFGDLGAHGRELMSRIGTAANSQAGSPVRSRQTSARGRSPLKTSDDSKLGRLAEEEDEAPAGKRGSVGQKNALNRTTPARTSGTGSLSNGLARSQGGRAALAPSLRKKAAAA